MQGGCRGVRARGAARPVHRVRGSPWAQVCRVQGPGETNHEARACCLHPCRVGHACWGRTGRAGRRRGGRPPGAHAASAAPPACLPGRGGKAAGRAPTPCCPQASNSNPACNLGCRMCGCVDVGAPGHRLLRLHYANMHPAPCNVYSPPTRNTVYETCKCKTSAHNEYCSTLAPWAWLGGAGVQGQRGTARHSMAGWCWDGSSPQPLPCPALPPQDWAVWGWGWAGWAGQGACDMGNWRPQAAMLRSYHVECTGSHQNSEVKLRWAGLVLG